MTMLPNGSNSVFVPWMVNIAGRSIHLDLERLAGDMSIVSSGVVVVELDVVGMLVVVVVVSGGGCTRQSSSSSLHTVSS